MRKLAILSAPIAVVTAVIIYIIRRSWWVNALEFVKAPPAEASLAHTETLVVRAGAWQSGVIVALGAIAIVFALAFSLSCRRELFSEGYGLTLAGASSTPRFIPKLLLCGGAVSGLLLLAAGITLLNSGWGFALLTSVFSFLSAVAVVAVPFNAILRKSPASQRLGGHIMALSLIPELLMTLMLVTLYRDNQTDPVVLRYAPIALALSFSAMSYYTDAAYVFKKNAPARSVFFKFCAIVTTGAALADVPKRYHLARQGISGDTITDAVRRSAGADFWAAAGFALVASLILSCFSLLALSWTFKNAAPESSAPENVSANDNVSAG